MKPTLATATATVAALFAVCLSACDTGPNFATYPGLLDLPSATVVEVNTTAPVPGRYNVRATVVWVSVCWCPKGAMCIPCQPDGLLLSESGAPQPVDGIAGEPNFLYVEADDPEQFEVGRRYAFSIDVDAQQTQISTRHAELLGYEQEQ